ncbi:MAG: response regulator transcription factor [Pirellulales bacterium]
MNRLNLLVVEDDPVIGKSLRQGLNEAGHECEWVKTGDDGLAAAASQQHDAVVLDILLPGKSGLEVLRELRTRGNRTPTILLTALGSVEERVAGLNAGADDYLVKPFALPELLARIEAVCRRAAARPAPVLQAGLLSLDLTNRRVTAGQREVDLSPTEFSLLEMLMRHAGQVVTAQDALRALVEERLGRRDERD